MPDTPSTLDYYAKNAGAYAAEAPGEDFKAQRDQFTKSLPKGVHILELGCGGGHDARAFMDAGFKVTALDGSAELAAEAEKRIGQDVVVMDFADLDYHEEFDAIWASASLLHVPSDDLPAVLKKVVASLKEGGVIMASFKEGDKDWTDHMGRSFCAMDRAQLETLFTNAGFEVETITEIMGFGRDGQPTNWLWVRGQKPN
ncbi:MAG: class I SAM-dependent methyltransferase [Sneathiellales bacterium]|nr:class I SAM-dependent methyltransferase [Sneathiellales bacterium]